MVLLMNQKIRNYYSDLLSLSDNDLALHCYYRLSWNRSVIRPNLKKQNLEPVLSIYRLFSNLTFLSKLTGEIVSPKSSTILLHN